MIIDVALGVILAVVILVIAACLLETWHERSCLRDELKYKTERWKRERGW